MSLYSQFTTDKKLEKEGIFLEYGENSQGQPIRIRIRRAGGANEMYTKRLEAVVKPYRRQIQTETIETKKVDQLIQQVYAETVVIGWENVEDEAGQPMEFSSENCLKLFKDLPDLFNDVKEQASKAALFLANIREVDSGN